MASSILTRPHPFIFTRASYGLPAGVTLLLVGLVAPFGLDALGSVERWVLAMALGLVVALCIIGMVRGLQWAAPRWMQEDQWTVGKEILLLVGGVFCIGMVVFGAILVTQISEGTWWRVWLGVLGRTLSISIFPVVIMVLYEQYAHQRAQLQRAQVLNENLERTAVAEKVEAASPVVFLAENGKPALQVPADLVRYLMSDGNYVDVFYVDADRGLERSLIRNRLAMLRQLLPEEAFFACHKRYVVNLAAIREVRDNARNLEVRLDQVPDWIPVSRAQAAVLQGRLQGRTWGP